MTPKEDWICRLIWTIGDMAGLPVGTRIATNDDKLLICSPMLGGQWVDRTGQLYSPLVSWLPVLVLPPAVPTEGTQRYIDSGEYEGEYEED